MILNESGNSNISHLLKLRKCNASYNSEKNVEWSLLKFTLILSTFFTNASFSVSIVSICEIIVYVYQAINKIFLWAGR